MSDPSPNPFRLFFHMLAALFNNRSAFHEQWHRYQPSPASDAVVGRWTGEWLSEHSGHRGELRCVLVPGGEGIYRAFFHATFSKLFRVGYITDLKVELGQNTILLRGEENLGAFAGGIYRCDGEIIGNDFHCNYSCKYDEGTFRLKRLD